MPQDRRKQARKEADDRLANMMESSSDEESDGEDAQAAVEGGNALEFGREGIQFDSLIQTAHVLLDSGKPDNAEKLLSDCLVAFGRRWQSRWALHDCSNAKLLLL